MPGCTCAEETSGLFIRFTPCALHDASIDAAVQRALDNSLDRTLTEALAARGCSHRPARVHGKQEIVAANGSVIGEMSSAEAWAWLHGAVPK